MKDASYEAAMAEAIGLGLMTAKGEATDRCQCPTCGEVFSTEGNFDAHLSKGRNRDDYTGPWCQPPATVGLIQTGTIWHQPGSDEAVAARRSTNVAGGSDAEAPGDPQVPAAPSDGSHVRGERHDAAG